MGLSLLIAGFEWIPFLCLIAGMVLVIVEMFIPGFGVPGITGVILLVVGVILYAKSPLQALVLILIIMAILGTALTLVVHSASKGHLSKHLILNNSLEGDAEFPNDDDLDHLVGSEGTTLTVLRPSGIAEVNEVKLNVVSEGEFIPKASAVIISKVEGNRIVVKEKSKMKSIQNQKLDKNDQ